MTEGLALRGTTALVTGASGILGSHLTGALLEKGATVVALFRDDDPRSELVRSGNESRVVRVSGAVEDSRVVSRALVDYEVDYVFHLAAQTQVRHAHREPLAAFESNVRGTYVLLDAIRTLARPVTGVVVASSDKAYGASEVLPYTESHPLAGRNVYDASKSAADLISTAYAHSFGMPIAIARCGNLYGPGDLNWERIVPGTIRALLRGERPVIRSDGTLERDYLYVGDAVAAYLALAAALGAEHARGEAFNFGHGNPVTVLDLVSRIRMAVGRTDLEPIIEGSSPGEIGRQWLDASKAIAQLGWRPSYSLDEGLDLTVDWYRTHLT